MTGTRAKYVYVISAFLLGFGLGGVSLHVATAEGLFGLKDSVAQIGTSLVEMQKNVDALQKNMNTIKQAKDKLSTLPSGGNAMDAIKNFGK
jgi:prefoldin subunit 5